MRLQQTYFLCFEFISEEKNIVGWTQSKQLQAAFRGKAAADEIVVIMRNVPNPLDDDEATHNPIAIDIFAQTTFMLGSKSISHCQTAIAKYQFVFKVSCSLIFLSDLILIVFFFFSRNLYQMRMLSFVF
jgi:hypothetical protein